MGAGSIDALMHRVDEGFAPAISPESGFVAYFAVATVADTLETVSICQDKAATDASNGLASDSLRENLGDFPLARIEVSGGEVFVSRLRAGGARGCSPLAHGSIAAAACRERPTGLGVRLRSLPHAWLGSRASDDSHV